MKRKITFVWNIIKSILLTQGIFSGFFSYELIENELKEKNLKMSSANFNLFILAMHFIVNFFYFWIAALISLSDVFYDIIKESFFISQFKHKTNFFKTKQNIKLLKNTFSRWYSPLYEGLFLNLIKSNNYVICNI